MDWTLWCRIREAGCFGPAKVSDVVSKTGSERNGKTDGTDWKLVVEVILWQMF